MITRASNAHRQRGIGIEGAIGMTLLVGALSAGVWAFWHHYTSLLADLATTEAALHTATEAFDQQLADTNAIKADNARTATLLAKRTTTANQAQQEADRYAQLLNDARRDPAAVQWLDAPVPRAVWCGLRQRPAGVICQQDGKGAPAANPADRDAKPHADRVDRLRLDAVFASFGAQPGELQRRQIEFARMDSDAD